MSDPFYALSRVLTYATATVIATDPTNNDAKMNLAEIFEINGQLRKALDLVYQGEFYSISFPLTSDGLRITRSHRFS